jgi:hypothetical protein
MIPNWENPMRIQFLADSILEARFDGKKRPVIGIGSRHQDRPKHPGQSRRIIEVKDEDGRK